VDTVVQQMQARVAQKQLTLRVRLPDDLPPLHADPGRVVQILTNLVANACNYTLPGGEVVLSAHDQGNRVRISVSDTGIGIAEEDQHKIFSRFFRADDPVVQEAPGTGLGLSIVRSLVEMHGGDVQLESELGHGSTFSFTMPIFEGDDEDGAQ
jgi:signal transduction histidine kinase